MLYDTPWPSANSFAEAEESETALEKVRMTVDVLIGMQAHRTILYYGYPAVEPHCYAFDQEHEKDHALSENLRGLLTVYRYAIKAEVKIETGRAINKTFIGFMILMEK